VHAVPMVNVRVQRIVISARFNSSDWVELDVEPPLSPDTDGLPSVLGRERGREEEEADPTPGSVG
jgi:hypothetical protein